MRIFEVNKFKFEVDGRHDGHELKAPILQRCDLIMYSVWGGDEIFVNFTSLLSVQKYICIYHKSTFPL